MHAPDKVPLGMEVGLEPSDTVLDGDPAPLPQKGGRAPNFRPTSIVAKRLHGSIKMSLSMEVGIGPGHRVLDGDPTHLSQKGEQPPPHFQPMFVVAKRLDGSRCHLEWHLVRWYASVRGNIVLDTDPAPPPRSTASKFRPMYVAAKRLDGLRCH